MFEYNFGDSEFLMLFLVLVTLPYAADRAPRSSGEGAPTCPCEPPEPRRRSLDGSPAASILVVGDLMLDHFVIGAGRSDLARSAGTRSSSSSTRTTGWAAPPTSRTTSPRSADTSRCVGMVGEDPDAARLRAELERLGIGARRYRDRRRRCTTRKLRVVTTRNQQVARIDYEDDGEVDGDVEAAIVERISEAVGATPTPSSSPTT